MDSLGLGFYKSSGQDVKKDKLSFSKGKKEKVILDHLEPHGKSKSKSSKAKAEISKSKTARAGIVFPVARIHSKLKHAVPANARVGSTAAVFIAAVLEYLVAELCELAGNAAKDEVRINNGKNSASAVMKKVRISPRSIQHAITRDAEFAELLRSVTLSGGGVTPLSDQKLKQQLRIKDEKDEKKDKKKSGCYGLNGRR